MDLVVSRAAIPCGDKKLLDILQPYGLTLGKPLLFQVFPIGADDGCRGQIITIGIVLIFTVYFFLANRKQRRRGKLIERTVGLTSAVFNHSIPSADVSRRRVSDTLISTGELRPLKLDPCLSNFEVEFLRAR